MGKYPVYAIVALIFIGIIKLLEVSVFDADQYSKNKKASFSKSIKKKTEVPAKKNESTPKPAAAKSDTINLTEASSDTISMDSSESSPADEPISLAENEPSVVSNEESVAEATRSYSGFDDLKNTYLAPKLANLPAGQLRDDIVIRYYRHDKDGYTVYSLRDLGYYIHEKEAVETAGLGSNVMYYGSEVTLEDIQIVAYTLIDQGMELKSIQPTSFDWKYNSIEIGTDEGLEGAASLTSEDIKSFKK